MRDHEEVNVEKLIDGFDPANNKYDRHILYEVTGILLDKREFYDQESDESSNGHQG